MADLTIDEYHQADEPEVLDVLRLALVVSFRRVGIDMSFTHLCVVYTLESEPGIAGADPGLLLRTAAIPLLLALLAAITPGLLRLTHPPAAILR